MNPDIGKISLASPLGKSIAGKMEGDEVNITLGGETQEFEIVRLNTIHDGMQQQQ